MENKNEGSYYYDLFKFFNEQHNLLLLDSEIQDIIHAVESFQQNKEGENYMGDEDFKNSIATQIRFHTISGKSFEDTVESIFKNAVKWDKYPDEGENDVPGGKESLSKPVASHTSGLGNSIEQCTKDPNTCQASFCGWPHRCND